MGDKISTLKRDIKSGNADAKTKDLFLDYIVETTGLHKSKVIEISDRYFGKEFSGYLSKEEFIQVYIDITAVPSEKLKAEKLASHIFSAFDTNHDEKISFREFVIGYAFTSNADQTKRLNVAFDVYDIDNNDILTYNEFVTIGKAIASFYALEFKMDNFEKWFKSLDQDNDKKVTRKEFVEVMSTDTIVGQLMSPFD